MKNTLTLLLLILFSAFTTIVTANESRASTESCNTSYTLPENQWRQVSLPCNPGSSHSVSDVFGDDIADAFGTGTPSYPTNWVVYKYDLDNNGYTKLTQSDALNVGTGYWIIQKSGNDATLDLPVNSTPIAPIQSDACTADEGCFEILLKTNTNAVGWNMIGRSSHYSPTLGDARIQTSTPICAAGCDLDVAESEKLVHNQLWTYNGISGYTLASNPAGTLEPWAGYWAATMQNANDSRPTLLIPKEDSSPLPENPLSGRVTATTGVELNGVNVKVLKNGAEQNITTTTNAEGKFGLSLDPESEYTLSFTASGYANQVQRIKTPLAGQEVNIDVVLTPKR